jgi:DNA-directed RNA polymerase specialized sigma24 family protein
MMLRLKRSERPVQRANGKREDEFVARYDQIHRWALHLTANDAVNAQDLVQDAFVDFVQSESDSAEIQNLDAYLYTLLRNIHRSQLHRQIRRQQLHVPILDFDSASMAFPGVSHSHWLQVCQQLRQICEFACERKSASKTGSILILRFFLDYPPSEIVRITRLDSSNVERRLYLARREAKAYLENSPRLRTASKHQSLACDLSLDLQQQVFDSREGPCPPEEQLAELYDEARKTGPDPRELAHICSCCECLDRVNRKLGLPSLSERMPDAGGDGSGTSGPGGPGPEVFRWRRQLQRVREHRPQQLLLSVNGLPRVWQPVTGECSAVTVRLDSADPVEWLEVFSDQDVRLLSLPIEDSSCAETGRVVSLSDGRELSLLLRRESMGPTVRLTYRDPLYHLARSEPIAIPIVNPPRFLPVGQPALLNRWKRWLSPRILSPAVAVMLIVALLSLNVIEPSLSAAEALNGARRWGARSGGTSGLALHRTFDLIERIQPGKALPKRRVEVWREKNRKLVRLFDTRGALLESAHWRTDAVPPITRENAWQFEPSPETFQTLAPKIAEARLTVEGESIQLESGGICLTLNRKDFRPEAGLLHVAGEEFEFHEAASSSIGPEYRSWPSVEPETPLRPGAAAAVPKKEPIVTPDGSAAELRARQILHAKGADLGEQIEIHSLYTGVEITGVVDSSGRKQELLDALSEVRGLRVRLASPEDDHRQLQLPAASPVESIVRPPLLASWLQDNYPQEPGRQAFVSKVLGLSRNCVRRAFALQQLARRYPGSRDPAVRAIAADHTLELRRLFQELEESAAPVLGHTTQPGAIIGGSIPPVDVFRQIELLNRHLLNLLAHDASDEASRASLDEELAETRSVWRQLATTVAALSNEF